jgi:PhnB protein
MNIRPYLFFEGRCEEAIGFYRDSLGAEVRMLLRYKDAPEQSADPSTVKPENAEKIMHAALQIGETHVLASDGHVSGQQAFNGFGLNINVATDAEAERIFTALGVGGTVRMPMEKTFFASRFGMVSDRFGVLWLVMAGDA